MGSELLARLRTRAERGVVVMAASGTPSPKLKYADQVIAVPGADMVIRFQQSFQTSGDSLADVDVVHVTGPLDTLLRLNHRSTPQERLKRTRHFVEMLSTNAVALVRTLYGPTPELHHPLEAEAAKLLDAATTRFVVVDGATKTPDAARTVVIPYADMTERFAGYPTRDQVVGRLLCVADGTLDAVAESALKTFFVARTQNLSLRLAGEADDAILAELERAVARTPETITSRIEVLSDAALIEEITAAEFVLVPEPRTLAGYHLIMMALTFGRPVLAPVNEMLLALRREVGDAWVVPLELPITAERLDNAIAQSRALRKTERPDLTGRGWEATGRRYARVLRDAVDEIRSTIKVPASINTNELESVSA